MSKTVVHYPLWVRDRKVRDRANLLKTELSAKFGRAMTQQDLLVHLMDFYQSGMGPAMDVKRNGGK